LDFELCVQGGSLKVYDLTEGKAFRSLPGHRSNVTSLDYHPFGEFVVSRIVNYFRMVRQLCGGLGGGGG
jgi:WD40 repeat protein